MSLTLKIIGKNYFLLNQYNLHFDNIFTINITYKANIFKVSVIIFNVYIAQFLYNQNLFHDPQFEKSTLDYIHGRKYKEKKT